MAVEGRIRRLLVRPFQSVDLAFNMSGVLSSHNAKVAKLGHRVSAKYEYADLYSEMTAEFELSGGQPQSITFNAKKISDKFELADPSANPGDPELLFSLRNESLKAGLDQVFLRRQNDFLERYQHRDDIVRKFEALYATTDWNVDPDASTSASPSSKIGRLKTLQRGLQKRFTELKAAYASYTVVKETEVDTVPSRRVQSDTKLAAGLGVSGMVHRTKVNSADNAANTQWLVHNLDDAGDEINPDGAQTLPVFWDGGSWKFLQPNPGDENTFQLSQRGTTTFFARVGGDWVESTGARNQITQKQFTKNRSYVAPKRDNDIGFQRRQANLMDEIVAEEITALGVPNMTTLMNNELRIIDNQVHKLQLNLTHTYLIPPISGVITAVYKDVGESVQTGEPVIRIEDDKAVLLVGRVLFRDNLRVGSTATIKTTDLYEKSQSLTLDAKVVSVRGHDADNDEWDIVLEADNPLVVGTDDPDNPASGRKLPINYHFDRDNTLIEFTV